MICLNFDQVGGTTDNIEETCATFASRALGLTTPLRTTHQIDNCTEGWYCILLYLLWCDFVYLFIFLIG